MLAKISILLLASCVLAVPVSKNVAAEVYSPWVPEDFQTLHAKPPFPQSQEVYKYYDRDPDDGRALGAHEVYKYYDRDPDDGRALKAQEVYKYYDRDPDNGRTLQAHEVYNYDRDPVDKSRQVYPPFIRDPADQTAGPAHGLNRIYPDWYY